MAALYGQRSATVYLRPVAYQTILLDRPAGHVALITLNRPESLNALNATLRQELDGCLAALDEDEEVRAIVVTGAGPRAFSSGGDIHERVKAEPAERKPGQLSPLSGVAWRMANLRKPTIGAINGLAYGGAALYASALDLRVGCERSSFRFLAASYGLVNATWTLPLLVGWARAKELLYTGREVGADEALAIGLLNKLVPSSELLPAAIEMAGQIAANSPAAVQAVKRLLHEDVGRGWADMAQAEAGISLPRERESERFKSFLDRGKLRG